MGLEWAWGRNTLQTWKTVVWWLVLGKVLASWRHVGRSPPAPPWLGLAGKILLFPFHHSTHRQRDWGWGQYKWVTQIFFMHFAFLRLRKFFTPSCRNCVEERYSTIMNSWLCSSSRKLNIPQIRLAFYSFSNIEFLLVEVGNRWPNPNVYWFECRKSYFVSLEKLEIEEILAILKLLLF